MKEIQLSQGKIAQVDDGDFDYLNGSKWFAQKDRRGNYYARRLKTVNGKQVTVLMHRAVMMAPEGMDVYYINHNTLDNRKQNLRICTHQETLMNMRKTRGTSIYKGVSLDKAANKWQATIQINGKTKKIGRFESDVEAAKVYDQAALKLFGEFARLNFPAEYQNRQLELIN